MHIGVVNNISFVYPSMPLLTQQDDYDESIFCNETTKPPTCNMNTTCRCVYRVKVELGAIVELVIVDRVSTISQVNHPFHIHGHKFYVMQVGMPKHGVPMTLPLVKSMMSIRNATKQANKYYPIKDTVGVPTQGFIVLRFKADNPGFWLLHCHFGEKIEKVQSFCLISDLL